MSRKNHCKYGHEFTEENTRYYPPLAGKRVMRKCRTCDARLAEEVAAGGRSRKPSSRSLWAVRVRNKGLPQSKSRTVRHQEKMDAMWAAFLARPETKYKQLMLEAKVAFDQWEAECKANRKRKGGYSLKAAPEEEKKIWMPR